MYVTIFAYKELCGLDWISLGIIVAVSRLSAVSLHV